MRNEFHVFVLWGFYFVFVMHKDIMNVITTIFLTKFIYCTRRGAHRKFSMGGGQKLKLGGYVNKIDRL